MRLTTEDLYYGDRGHKWLCPLSISLSGGLIVLAGPNGSGKTLLMRLFAGVVPPSGGSIHWDGQRVRSDSLDWRRKIGYLPQDFAGCTQMTGERYLLHMASLKLIPRRLATRRTTEVLERLYLGHCAETQLRAWSHGQRQRLGLAQALLADPELLLLDEPLRGINPVDRDGILAVLAEQSERSIVLISSHDLEHIVSADQMLVLKDGQLVSQELAPRLIGLWGSLEQAYRRIIDGMG